MMNELEKYWQKGLYKVLKEIHSWQTEKFINAIIDIRLNEHEHFDKIMDDIIMKEAEYVEKHDRCSTSKCIKLELLTSLKARYDLILMGKGDLIK